MANPPRKKGPRKAPKRKASAAVKRKAAQQAAPKKKAAASPVRRPPEIPAAQWRGYSASYKKRLSSFYRRNPGAPRYLARGKKAGESLSLAQRRAERLEALAERQSYRGQRYGARDADSIMESYRALIADKGWSAFNTLERLIRDRQKGEGRITADELGFDWSDYGGDESELFYN